MLTADPSDPDLESVYRFVKDYVKSGVRKRGGRVWIIHRLDREASGLLVFAKSERAFEMLKAELKARRMHRIYTAVLEGEGLDPAGTVQSYLYEDARGVVHAAKGPGEIPKHLRRDDEDEVGAASSAVTHYRVLGAGHGRTLVALKLETGRKHQIRVHMKQMGRSILGDGKYGAARGKGVSAERLCLHATELGFTHPATGEHARFVSHAPSTFYRIAGLRPGDGPALETLFAAGNSGVAREPAASAPAERAAGSKADRKTERKASADSAGWDHVAEWYDQYIEERVSDHHEMVILPGVQRMLGLASGQSVLDVACGTGVLCRRLSAAGAKTFGVDASDRLVARAQSLDPKGRYVVGDARDLAACLPHGERYNAAACVMAIMNIEPISPVLAGVAAALSAGGAFVVVLLHPAFRAPGQTAWGWDDAKSGPVQFRRVDGYLSSASREIVMNPGAVSSGAKPVITFTHHRAVSVYINALALAGLIIDHMEEWPSLRQSQPGPRASAENRARREIPMFLAIRARKS